MQSESQDQLSTGYLPFLKKELRGLCSPLPENILHYLNEIQSAALSSLEQFGWQLAFVRRSLFVAPIIVVQHVAHEKFAVLEEDGSVNLAPGIIWRH